MTGDQVFLGCDDSAAADETNARVTAFLKIIVG